MIHYAEVKENKIIFFNENLFNQDLQKHNNKEIQIEIKPKDKSQTTAQRNYFHLILSIFCEYSGDDEESLKKAIKTHFGTKENYLDPISNEIKTETKSTADYNRKEYIDLINKFIEFLQESYPEFIIPRPETYKLNPNEYVINTIRNS